MNAIVVRQLGGPEVMRIESVPTPEPSAGQVLVRIKATGVNPVDTYIRSGTYARKPALPYIPGTDGAGVVESLGKGVTQFKPGDRVYLGGASVSGTYAEYCVASAEEVYALPKEVSFAQGAGIHVPYATAFYALFHLGKGCFGEFVMIHGASGGVGIAAVQLSRAAGMRIIATAGTERGMALVTREGAQHALNHGDPEHFDRVKAITGGRGVDVIVEMLANVNLGNDLKVLAPRGRVAVVGSRGEVQINPRELMGREASIAGMTLWGVAPADLERIHEALGAGLEAGTLRPIIGKELPLAEAPRAHADVLASGAYGKIVLVP